MAELFQDGPLQRIVRKKFTVRGKCRQPQLLQPSAQPLANQLVHFAITGPAQAKARQDRLKERDAFAVCHRLRGS